MKFDAILFDFDGVLIESEYAGNRQIADYLTGIGHPTTPEQSMAQFMGLAGNEFRSAISDWIGRPLPDDFEDARRAEDMRAIAEGIDSVEGAVAFIRALPPALPKAICSSSSHRWIRAHLAHLGLADVFGDRIFSGREDVTHGKPAPDIYLHAAGQLRVPIARCCIIEDSPVGVTAAVASGAYVIGLCAGTHCAADHGARLAKLGADAIAADFNEVARLIA